MFSHPVTPSAFNGAYFWEGQGHPPPPTVARLLKSCHNSMRGPSQ